MSAPEQVPFGKEKEFLVSSTGEAVYDGIQVGRVPGGWFKWDISLWVQPGFIHRARVNYFQKHGTKILRAFLVSAGITVWALIGVLMFFGRGNSHATPPALWEVVATSPITLLAFAAALVAAFAVQGVLKKVKGVPFQKFAAAGVIGALVAGVGYSTYANWHFTDGQQQSSGPAIEMQSIQWGVPAGVQFSAQEDWVTKSGDLNAVIKSELSSLNETGKLYANFATKPMTDVRDTWSTPAVVKMESPGNDLMGNPLPPVKKVEGGKPDTFRVVVLDNAVFIFSIVLAENRWMPWSGVFHKDQGKGAWTYHNLSIPGVPAYQVAGYSSVSIMDIPETAAKAFPQLVRQSVSKM